MEVDYKRLPEDLGKEAEEELVSWIQQERLGCG